MAGNEMDNMDRKAVILRYAGLAARELSESDPQALSEIAQSKKEIAQALALTPEEIILEVNRILVPNQNQE